MQPVQTAEKIDVHGIERSYATTIAKLRGDPAICPANRQHIEDYLRDCRLGKTIIGRSKKRIGSKRLSKNLSALKGLNGWLGNKDFRSVTQRKMEDFITKLDENRLTLMKSGRPTEVSYKAWTQHDFKVVLRKFYKWLLGNNRTYPEIVSWIDTSMQEITPSCLTLDQIKRCAHFAPFIKGKAIVMALFETGARAEEFLNIRNQDVERREHGFLVRIEYPKTYKRSVPIIEGAELLAEGVAIAVTAQVRSVVLARDPQDVGQLGCARPLAAEQT